MKILHMTVNLSHKAGGLYSAVSGLAKAQHELNQNDVLVLGACDPQISADLDEWGDVALKPIMTDVSYGPIIGACQIIREFKPDIIHQHGIWNSASVWGRYALFKGIPTVVSPHGMLDPWILKRSKLKKAVHSWLLEKPLARGAYFNALTKSEFDDIVKFCPSAASRISIVPNGILLPDHPADLSKKSDVIFLGRLHEKKQVLELVKAWSAIHKKTNLNLVVAGWGDDDYVQKVIAEVSVTDGVEFVGPVYGAKKSKIFENAKVFILPSLSEGLPMAVLESLSYGCIPIITDECNLPELVSSGLAECLALNLCNLDRCIEDIQALSTNNLMTRQAKAIKTAQNYSWGRQARSLISFYEMIVNENAHNNSIA